MLWCAWPFCIRFVIHLLRKYWFANCLSIYDSILIIFGFSNLILFSLFLVTVVCQWFKSARFNSSCSWCLLELILIRGWWIRLLELMYGDIVATWHIILLRIVIIWTAMALHLQLRFMANIMIWLVLIHTILNHNRLCWSRTSSTVWLTSAIRATPASNGSLFVNFLILNILNFLSQWRKFICIEAIIGLRLDRRGFT